MHDATVTRNSPPPDHAMIEIPDDVLDLLAKSPSAARTWRLAVRAYFQWAISNGYEVTSVHRDAAANRSFYLLRRLHLAAVGLPVSRELQQAT